MGRARVFRSDEPHIAGFGSGVVQKTRYGTAAVVKIGIGWPGSVVSSFSTHPPSKRKPHQPTRRTGLSAVQGEACAPAAVCVTAIDR
jgi:hypothetical protein